MNERTYENLNKSRRMRWRWKLVVALIVLVAIIVAVVVVGTEVLFGIPFAILLWAMIKYPPRKKYARKRKGWF